MKRAILFLLIIALVSRNKNDSLNDNTFSLPDETQTGTNTFAFYIEGKLFIPRDGTGTFNNSDNAISVKGDLSGNFLYQEYKIHDYNLNSYI